MRWLRFLAGLFLTVVLHSFFDYFFPVALTRLDLYAILVVFFAMSGHLKGVIFAGVVAGMTQDVFSGAIFGLHAFALTFTGYLVALFNTRIVVRGALAFGACLASAVLVNESVILALIRLLHDQRVGFMESGVAYTTIFTSLLGMLIYQIVETTLAREEKERESLKRRG